MGGSYEREVSSGIRMHIKNGDVHVHDDAKGLKFETSASDFKEEVGDALKQFKKKDGIIKITGNRCDDLYLLKEENKTKIFLLERKGSMKKELESFLKDC